jgi:hypothetical protein
MNNTSFQNLQRKLNYQNRNGIDYSMVRGIDITNNLVGQTGPLGPTGPVGPKGDKGEKGDLGRKGDRGERGEKGDKGDQGPEGGPTGPTGPAGEKGEQGIQGEKGEKGDIGPQGISGDVAKSQACSFYKRLPQIILQNNMNSTVYLSEWSKSESIDEFNVFDTDGVNIFMKEKGLYFVMITVSVSNLMASNVTFGVYDSKTNEKLNSVCEGVVSGPAMNNVSCFLHGFVRNDKDDIYGVKIMSENILGNLNINTQTHISINKV